MINYDDISQFFELEAEAIKENWDALMKLPIKERIHKRKAIKGVYLDKEYAVAKNKNATAILFNRGVFIFINFNLKYLYQQQTYSQ